MLSILKKVWPMAVVLIMFIVLSTLIRDHIVFFQHLLTTSNSAYGMAIYVLLGIATVIIPFGSVLPFIPLAVALWGWLPTALLTLLSWVLGGQLLFELARRYGKAFVYRLVSESRLNSISRLINNKGIFHAIMVRMFVHEDIVSYAYGIFTDISRWEFLIVTTVGVAPGAFLYAYFGSLPLIYQVAMASMGLVIVIIYFLMESKNIRPPSWLPGLGHPEPSASIDGKS